MVSLRQRLCADAALVYAAAIWGSTFFVVKATLEHIDAVVLVGYRFTAAAVLLAVYLLLKRQRLWQSFRHGLFLGVVLYVLYVAQTIGLGITKASNSGFITGLFIVFVPVLNWLWLRRRTALWHWAAVVIALIGLWLLTGGIAGVNAGDVMTLAAAVTYAVHVIYAGRCLRERVDPWVLNFQQMLTVGVLALATALVHGAVSPVTLPAHFAITSTAALWAVVFLTLFPTITAYVAQLYGQRFVSAERASLLFTLEPVFAAIFAWSLGGERLVMLSAIGGGLMVAAMVVSELPRNSERGQPPTSGAG